jgi:hypothetical protein
MERKFQELSIVSESTRFKKHLDLEENSRMIFSGIFGIGKSYFTERFFKENHDDFISIKLNPVNYSVSSNQDIFELIKYDIGFQLFSQNVDFEKLDFETYFAGQFYLLDNYKETIRLLTKNLAKIDRRINAIVSSILEVGGQIKNFKESIQKDEKAELKNFLETYILQEGTAREENLITELLCALIASLKAKYSKKKVVLVIDDLDRIDPEHIFRILNVFSAHYDYQGIEGENKFDFDKIILICDIENIRGIFHHKYGASIDFSGYIDKFYSLEVFEYNFSTTLIENLQNFLFDIDLKEKGGHLDLKSGDNYYVSELSFLLEHFIGCNKLNMRTLLNFLKKEIVLPSYAVQSDYRNTRFYVKSTPIFIVIEFLELLFGGYINLLKAIDAVIDKTPKIEVAHYEGWTNRRMGNIIALADYARNGLKISPESYLFVDEEINIRAVYKIEPVRPNGFLGDLIRLGEFSEAFDIESSEPQEIMSKSKIDYFRIFKRAYQIYHKIPKIG